MPDHDNATPSMVSAVHHIALMTSDLDRLANFYESVFDAKVLARSDGSPRKCFMQLTANTSFHIFETPAGNGREPGDEPMDRGSINHFALTAPDPETFVEIRRRLLVQERTRETVTDAPHGYTIFATDPDGLFLEVILSKPVVDWEPPFPLEAFRPLGS